MSVIPSEVSDRSFPTLERVRECFDLDVASGILTWRRRPRDHFATQRAHSTWLHRYAGKQAGSISGYGYLRITIRNRPHLVHRIVYALHHGIELADLPDFLDHIDGCKTNNRPANLRPATKAQNTYNAKTPATNTSGFKGVYWHARHGRWYARIVVNGKFHHLGCHHTAEEASDAYEAAAAAFHGEFYRSEQPAQKAGAA